MSFEKPPGLRGTYPSQWRDPAMAEAYAARPPYSEGLFDTLLGLRAGSAPVLDLGAGTGDVACRLARRGCAVHGVELSSAMLERARLRPGGDRVRWIHAAAEEAPYAGPYSLVVAGESVHWLDFDAVFARLMPHLTEGAVFAVAGRGDSRPQCWPQLQPLIQTWSTNQHYTPYRPVDLLTRSGWFLSQGRWRAQPAMHLVSVDSYLTSLHSRNGLGPGHLGPQAHRAFDAEARALLDGEADGGSLALTVASTVVWGRLSPPDPTATPPIHS